jgi:pre-mRNA-processing factor 40
MTKTMLTEKSTPTFVAGGTVSFPRSGGFSDHHNSYNVSSGIQQQVHGLDSSDPTYSSFEEAEAAFLKLLRRVGVQADWTWERTMKAIIKDPQYRSLKDPKERKVAFEKLIIEMRDQEKEREKARITKLRHDFTTMLKRHAEIKHYSRWKTVRPIVQGETIFRSTSNDDERKQLFAEYVSELRKSHAEHESNMRKLALEELSILLNSLDLDAYTRWSEAQTLIHNNEQFQQDEKFRTLSKLDVLTVYESHIKGLERSSNEKKQTLKAQRLRRERRNRDGFVALLKELRKAGKLKAGTKWSQLYPLLENDDRYLAILGQTGSTPLELFWDLLEEEERTLRTLRNDVLDVLDVSNWEPLILMHPTNMLSFNRISDSRSHQRQSLTSFYRLLSQIVERLSWTVMTLL